MGEEIGEDNRTGESIKGIGEVKSECNGGSGREFESRLGTEKGTFGATGGESKLEWLEKGGSNILVEVEDVVTG